MKILHNISSVDQAYGGPLFSMKLIAESQRNFGHEVAIISSVSNEENSMIEINNNVKVIKIPSISKFRYMKNWENLLFKEFGKPQIIHTYGIWTFHNMIASSVAKKYKLPHIIAPCGMLYNTNFNKKTIIPKKIIWRIFQNKALLNANIIHSKSEAEYNNIIKVMPKIDKNKVKVIPNPIELVKSYETNYDLGLDNILKSKKYLLYVGRLDPVKGLISLINVWNEIIINHCDWRLIITGGDGNSGYLNVLKKNIRRLKNINLYDYTKENNDCDNFKYSNLVLTGPLYGAEKGEIYKNASIFINPSNFENFGMTIAEALKYNLPVIISKNTPWDAVRSENCGWLLSDKNANLKSILNSALIKSSEELMQLGKKSSNLVKNLSPDNIALQNIKLYRNLIKLNKTE